MNDVCRFSRDHVVECSERTVLSCLEPICFYCLCWRREKFSVRTTFFIFNGTYYQQTEGVAMGGPPSSIVAEIYMQGTETTALATTSHPRTVWECHVGYVFSIIYTKFQPT